MRTFRQLDPLGKQFDRIEVRTTPEKQYDLRYYKGETLVHESKWTQKFPELLREIEAQGCCISQYRHLLPKNHLDSCPPPLKNHGNGPS